MRVSRTFPTGLVSNSFRLTVHPCTWFLVFGENEGDLVSVVAGPIISQGCSEVGQGSRITYLNLFVQPIPIPGVALKYPPNSMPLAM